MVEKRAGERVGKRVYLLVATRAGLMEPHWVEMMAVRMVAKMAVKSVLWMVGLSAES